MTKILLNHLHQDDELSITLCPTTSNEVNANYRVHGSPLAVSLLHSYLTPPDQEFSFGHDFFAFAMIGELNDASTAFEISINVDNIGYLSAVIYFYFEGDIQDGLRLPQSPQVTLSQLALLSTPKALRALHLHFDQQWQATLAQPGRYRDIYRALTAILYQPNSNILHCYQNILQLPRDHQVIATVALHKGIAVLMETQYPLHLQPRPQDKLAHYPFPGDLTLTPQTFDKRSS
jgi:hypothetical protein